MGITVGELAVKFDANARELQGAMRTLERRVGSFERNVSQRTQRIGTSFRRIAGVVAGLGTAFLAFRGTQALIRFGVASVRTAAEFEGFEVRLKNFLGTQEAASRAVERFTELSSRTPFAVSEIVEAGTVLGTVALGNERALQRLTATAANLSAVTGIPLRETASNLQRSLTAGIASADQFRERGVRLLIEAITGIPDLTAEPLARQAELFDQVFGPDGVFGDAAANLSFTLGGALSNIGDAATRLQASLGAAFAPGVIAGLREFLIPLLDRLRALVEQNSTQIRDFAFNALRGLASAFAGVVRSIEFAVRGIALFQRLILDARAAQARFANTVGAGLNAVGLLSDRTAEALQGVRDQAVGEAAAGTPVLDELAEGASRVADEVGKMAASFQNIDIDAFVAQQKKAQESSAELQAALERARTTQAPAPRDATAERRQLQVSRRLLDLRRRLVQADLEREDPLRAQVAALDRQIEQAAILVGQAQDPAAQQAGADVLGQLSADRETLLADIRRGPAFTALRDGAANALREGFEGFAAGDTGALKASLGGLLEETAEASLSRAFAKSTKGLGESLNSIFDSISGKLQGIFGKGVGSALTGALGIGLSLAQRALGASESSSSFSAGAAMDRVEASREIRGVVVGPTQVAIAQVDRAIADAFVGTNRILERIEANTRRAAEQASGGGGSLDPDPGSDESIVLATESESLI